MYGRLVLSLSALALLAPAAPAASALPGESSLVPGRAFALENVGCEEAQVVVPIDAAVADEFLPDDFVVNPNPFPSVGVTVIRCQGISIDGAPASAGVFSDVGIAVLPPDGSPGRHIYQLWQPGNHAELWSRMEHLGMAGGLVAETSLTVTPVGADGNVPWEKNPYSLTAVSPTVAAIPLGASSNTWWHAGDRGLIRISYQFDAVDATTPLAGVVRAAPRSPLSRLMGAEERVGVVASILRIPRYTGTAELVHPHHLGG